MDLQNSNLEQSESHQVEKNMPKNMVCSEVKASMLRLVGCCLMKGLDQAEMIKNVQVPRFPSMIYGLSTDWVPSHQKLQNRFAMFRKTPLQILNL